MQFGTSISVFHVRSATAESAVISRPAYSVYVPLEVQYIYHIPLFILLYGLIVDIKHVKIT